MDTPLSTWYCDVCGNSITDYKKGYVIWKSNINGFGFKIIHQGTCDQREYISSNALEQFLGPKGLSYCLKFLSAGPIIHNNAGSSNMPDLPDMSEYADFVRRVQVPYYEQARRYFSDHDLLADYSDANEFYPYIPENLQSIIKKYGSGL
jgi:hypothetical protein